MASRRDDHDVDEEDGGQDAGGEYDGESGTVSAMAVMVMRRMMTSRMKPSDGAVEHSTGTAVNDLKKRGGVGEGDAWSCLWMPGKRRCLLVAG